MQKENWKDIPNFKGVYKISSFGRVKSFKLNKERILKPGICSSGYCIVVLSLDLKRKSFRIHQLVAMAFLNHTPDGTNKLVIDHINNLKSDNKLSNLQIISNRDNCIKKTKGKSKYRGVQWCETHKKWKSQIRYKNKRLSLGSFKNETEASEAYELKKTQIENEM
jgi:hypothetical protein